MNGLILISDSLFELSKKGELTGNYYNPSNIFSKIYFPEFFGHKVNQKKLQHTAGRAKVVLIPAALSRLRRFLIMILPFFSPLLLLAKLSKIVKQNKIQVIRCYGHRFNLVLGIKLKKMTGLPLVVSLHTNPDHDIMKKELNIFRKVILILFDRTETSCLQEADLVIGVYQSIVPYLRKRKIKRYTIIYNAVEVSNSNT